MVEFSVRCERVSAPEGLDSEREEAEVEAEPKTKSVGTILRAYTQKTRRVINQPFRLSFSTTRRFMHLISIRLHSQQT